MTRTHNMHITTLAIILVQILFFGHEGLCQEYVGLCKSVNVCVSVCRSLCVALCKCIRKVRVCRSVSVYVCNNLYVKVCVGVYRSL